MHVGSVGLALCLIAGLPCLAAAGEPPPTVDPWAILSTTPGVATDRIQLDGSESCSCSAPRFADDSELVPEIEPATLTAEGACPAALGDTFEIESPPIVPDRDDPAAPAPSVRLDVTHHRGVAEWRGQARLAYAGEPESSGNPSQNRLTRVGEDGGEVGGPVAPDRLWIWLAGGRNEVDRRAVGDAASAIRRRSLAAKINAQVGLSTSIVAELEGGDFREAGFGAGPARAEEATSDLDGEAKVADVSVTRVFGSSVLLTGDVSSADGEVRLTPSGGDARAAGFDAAGDVWRDGAPHRESTRSARQAKLDAIAFFETGTWSHELKAGVGYREVGLTSSSRWPGGGLRYDGANGATYAFRATRPTADDLGLRDTVAYLEDTLAHRYLTLRAGLRWDRRSGGQRPVAVAAVPGFEAYGLGAARFPGQDLGFTWSDLSPRVSGAWVFGRPRDSRLRFAAGRFADELGRVYGSFTQPLAPRNGGFALFEASDEVGRLVGTNGFDPAGLRSLNRVDPDFRAPTTDQASLAFDQKLGSRVELSAVLSWRRRRGLVDGATIFPYGVLAGERLVIDPGLAPGLCDGAYFAYAEPTADGCLRTLVTGDTVASRVPVEGSSGATAIPVHRLRDGLVDSGGRYLTNGDLETIDRSLSLLFLKRLGDRWRLEARWTLAESSWRVREEGLADPNRYLGGFHDDGAPVLAGSLAETPSAPSSPGWSYAVRGLLQIAPDRRFGLLVELAVHGREGYVQPLYVRGSVFDDGSGAPTFAAGPALIQAAADAGAFRYEDVHLVDLRLEKELDFGEVDVVFGLDVFNLLDSDTGLARSPRLEAGSSVAPSAGRLERTVDSRTIQLGVRLFFG